MAYEMRELCGNLFPQADKTGKQPDYKGTVLINGKIMSIAGWKMPGKNGPFLSLKISEIMKKAESPAFANVPSRPSGPDDDLPF